MTTESALRDWRYGQTQAERLCAGILSIERFTAVDPQHPLGGPDGIKDVMCRRGITKFVAAAYFPPTISTFTEVKKKFQSDLAGVKKNSADGFVFFVNQPLTISERKELTELGEYVVKPVELYHLERLRTILDSPAGCGLRLEYLRIAMTHEEQIAYWSSGNIDIKARLDRIESLQQQTLHQLASSTDAVLNRTSAMHIDLNSRLSSTFTPGPPVIEPWTSGPATASIDVSQLLWIHRLILTGTGIPDSMAGNLRTINVSVESMDLRTGSYTPPVPEDIPQLITNWCKEWRDGYNSLLAQDPDSRLDGICRSYYEFLRIHPFTDGNGRMGRVLLDQMFRELLGKPLPPSYVDARLELQDALLHANAGDLTPLRSVLAAALS